MRDPWHEETLGQLVLFLSSRAPVRFAVVITSSEELEEEVVESLKGKHAGAIWHSLELEGHGDLESFQAWRRLEPDSRRVVLVRGLSRVVSEGGETEILGAFNYQREAIAERGEGLVFFLDEGSAAKLMAAAPDFFRFTLGFSFKRIGDLFKRAQAEEAEVKLTQMRPQFPSSSLEEELAQAQRFRDPRRTGRAFYELAIKALDHGDVRRAERFTEDLESVAVESEDPYVSVWWLDVNARIKWRKNDNRGSLRSLNQAAERVAANNLPNELGHHIDLLRLEGLVRQGKVEAARELARETLGAMLFEDRIWNAVLICKGARFLIEQGLLKEASRILLKDLPAPVPHSGQRDFLFVTGLLLVARGDLHLGADFWGRMNTYLQSPSYESQILYARLCMHHGELTEAQGHLGTDILDSIRNGEVLSSALFLKAKLESELNPVSVQLLDRVNNWLKRIESGLSPILGLRSELLMAEVRAGDSDIRTSIETVREVTDELLAMGQLESAEAEHVLGRLYRLDGDLDRSAELAEAAARRSHEQGAMPIAARADTERAFVALARGDAAAAREHADAALSNIAETRFRRDEPAALAARSEARRRLGEDHKSDEKRWRRLVRGMGAKGLEQRIEQSLEAT